LAELGEGFVERAADGVLVASYVPEVGAEGYLSEAVAEEDGVGMVLLLWREVGAAFFEEGERDLHSAFEHAGFDAGNALQAPLGGGHLLDEEFFEGADGLEVFFERSLELEEGAGVFARKNGVAGEEAVFDGIAAGGGFAFRGFGAGAQESIAAIGIYLCLTRHNITDSMVRGGMGAGPRISREESQRARRKTLKAKVVRRASEGWKKIGFRCDWLHFGSRLDSYLYAGIPVTRSPITRVWMWPVPSPCATVST